MNEDNLYAIGNSLFSIFNTYLKDNSLNNEKYNTSKPLYFTTEQCEKYSTEIKELNIKKVKQIDALAKEYLNELMKIKEG